MARIFRQQYTTTDPDGRKRTQKSRKWYIEYRDGQRIRRRVPGYADKQATQQYAAVLERRAEREQSGLLDRYAEHRKRPLRTHLEEYEKHLRATTSSTTHVNTVIPRIRKVLEGCKCTFWPDVNASKVQAYIASLKTSGRSVQTCNFYLQAAKQFCRWMVQDDRAPDSPLQHLQRGNVRVDRRHDRRALTDDELRWLLDTTGKGPHRFGMAGADRAVLYRLALETGLRASELRSLTWSSFDLDADPPAVTVKAS